MIKVASGIFVKEAAGLSSYMLPGAALGAGIGALTGGDGDRLGRGIAGGVLGGAAGGGLYALLRRTADAKMLAGTAVQAPRSPTQVVTQAAKTKVGPNATQAAPPPKRTPNMSGGRAATLDTITEMERKGLANRGGKSVHEYARDLAESGRKNRANMTTKLETTTPKSWTEYDQRWGAHDREAKMSISELMDFANR